MEQILREKLTVPSVVTKISFYVNRKCITTFTKACYVPLFWPDQANPFFILILVVLSSFPVVLRLNAGHGLLILEVSRSHTMTHHRRQNSSGRVIGSSQRNSYSYILILSYNLFLGLPSDLFLQVSPPTPVCTSPLPHTLLLVTPISFVLIYSHPPPK